MGLRRRARAGFFQGTQEQRELRSLRLRHPGAMPGAGFMSPEAEFADSYGTLPQGVLSIGVTGQRWIRTASTPEWTPLRSS